MKEKGQDERGPEKHSKNSDFGTPLILVLFSGRPKNAVKNSTAEKQLFGAYHDCFHFGLGPLLATRFLDPFPGDLAVSQALSQRSATHCRR